MYTAAIFFTAPLDSDSQDDEDIAGTGPRQRGVMWVRNKREVRHQTGSNSIYSQNIFPAH